MPGPSTSLPQPTAYSLQPQTSHLAHHKFVVELPAEIWLAAEDMAQVQGMTLAKWVQEYCVLGLQMQLFS